MTKTLLIPGLDGSPDPHWQHWWALRDPDAIFVDLSRPQSPDPTLWELELAGTILQHPGAILVGHSLGAVLVARLLSRWANLDVAAAIMVAPAEPQGNARIARFGPIAELPLHLPSLVIASRNDPWMRFSRATELAKVWGAEMVDMGFAGHINVQSGFGPWPQGVRLRDSLLQHRSNHASGMGHLILSAV